jgi:hypothetical protein
MDAVTLQRVVLVATQAESFRAASVHQGGSDCDPLASEFVSAEEARRLLGISHFTLRRLRHRTVATRAPTPPNGQKPPAA